MKVLSLLGLILLTLSFAPPLVAPPFVRKWTQVVGNTASVIVVREGQVYYRSNSGIGAIELSTGKRQWSSLAGQRVVFAAVYDQSIYAMVTDYSLEATVQVVDIKSGKARVLFKLERAHRSLAVDARHVYALDKYTMLRAYDRETGMVAWSRRLTPNYVSDINLLPMVVTGDTLVLSLENVGEFGLDITDGRILWNRPDESSTVYPLLIVGDDIIRRHGTLCRFQARTGTVVWEASDAAPDAVLVEDVLISSDRKNFEGRAIRDGRVLWKLPLRNPDGFYVNVNEIPYVSQGESAWMLRQPVTGVTKNGEESWRHPEPFTGTPCYADLNWVITVEEGRIFGYVRGMLPPIPTTTSDKRILAERLVAQFEFLDNIERRQLDKLVPFVIPPLLARYVEWCKAYRQHNQDKELDYPLSALIMDSALLLETICRKEDTQAIVAALAKLDTTRFGDFGTGELERILLAKGGRNGHIRTLVQRLRGLPFNKRGDSQDLLVVSQSSHPEAVKLMLEALRDPQASPAWREAAFQHLAGTGGAEGVQAVRNARPRRGPRKPWLEQIDPAKLEQKMILGTKTDSKGRAWMLFQSGILGNTSDLYIVEKRKDGWGKPLFTGAWTRTDPQFPPPDYRGIPIAKLVDTEWINIFPDDGAIRQDTDDDGLTDIVEMRLGTGLKNKDTDEDGLSDLVDPCPNIAPRALNDTEKLIAACIEAAYFGEDGDYPAIISLEQEGVVPFELYGYPCPVMWREPEKYLPLSEVDDRCANVIDFSYPNEDARQQRAFIRYSADRKTARTVINYNFGFGEGGGMEVTLKKIGEEWFVVDLTMAWIE